MWWFILGGAAVIILALGIRKAAKGTPFARRCPCTPYIEHLRHVEEGSQKHRKENLW